MALAAFVVASSLLLLFTRAPEGSGPIVRDVLRTFGAEPAACEDTGIWFSSRRDLQIDKRYETWCGVGPSVKKSELDGLLERVTRLMGQHGAKPDMREWRVTYPDMYFASWSRRNRGYGVAYFGPGLGREHAVVLVEVVPR